MEEIEKQRRTLPKKFAQQLNGNNESGMDYHIIDITLKDGSIVKDVAIVGCEYIGQIRGYKGPMPPFDVNDIKNIKITHSRWKFSEA